MQYDFSEFWIFDIDRTYAKSIKILHCGNLKPIDFMGKQTEQPDFEAPGSSNLTAFHVLSGK